jgi:hypothetical protein
LEPPDMGYVLIGAGCTSIFLSAISLNIAVFCPTLRGFCNRKQMLQTGMCGLFVSALVVIMALALGWLEVQRGEDPIGSCVFIGCGSAMFFIHTILLIRNFLCPDSQTVQKTCDTRRLNR